MSFILDALRKSDHRRRMGTAPGLQTSHSSEPPRNRRKPGWLVSGLAITLIAVAGFIAFHQRERLETHWQSWLGQDPSPTGLNEPPESVLTEDTIASAPADSGNQGMAVAETDDQQRRDMVRERVVTDPARARAEIERLIASRQHDGSATETQAKETSSTPIDRRAPTYPRSSSVVAQAPERPHVQAPDPVEAERIQRQLLQAQQRREEGKTGNPGDQGSDQEIVQSGAVDRSPGEEGPVNPAETVWTPQASEYVRSWELPLSIRRNMPALSLTIHVYAEKLEDRFVLINGERFVSGDELVDGARLVDIRREGAVVDYRDYRFLLEP